jgi:hypothetical protein
MTGRPNRPHHQGSYPRRAAALRAAAGANPHTVCWRCGMTYAEYAARHGAKAARWQAGHTTDSQVNGQLLPEHARCNASAGAAHGNRLREPHSQRWY